MRHSGPDGETSEPPGALHLDEVCAASRVSSLARPGQGSTPTCRQASLTAVAALALCALACRTVIAAKARKRVPGRRRLSSSVSYQMCPAVSQALPPMASAASAKARLGMPELV